MANPITTLRKNRNKRRKQKRKEARKAARPAPVPFVVGVNRSGTTLLRMMLDAHPQLAMPPETHFIPALNKEMTASKKEGARWDAAQTVEFLVAHRRWGDFGLDRAELEARLAKQGNLHPKKVLREFYGLYAEGQGKKRFGDKTPGYVKQMGMIQRSLPEARFVHLIRDGRDVALSRDDRSDSEDLTVDRLAKIWKRRINRARGQKERLKHYMEVRFEDLVADPEPELRRVCEFIDLPYDAAMLTYHERSGERLQEMDRDLTDDDGGALRPAEDRLEAHSLVTEAPRSDRVERWRELMSAEDLAAFEEVAGDLLAELGYPLSSES